MNKKNSIYNQKNGKIKRVPREKFTLMPLSTDISSISLENKLKQIDDNMIHVQFVTKGSYQLAEELMLLNEGEQALALIERVVKPRFLEDFPLTGKEETLKEDLVQLNLLMIHVLQELNKTHHLIKTHFQEGREQEGLSLMKNILQHDYSKSLEDEFYGLAAFSDDVRALKDPNANSVVDEKFKIIRLHWQRNDHHPEKWADKMPTSLVDETPLVIREDMSTLALAEMCCDWWSRSAQYGTDVMEFYRIRTQKRWKFSPQQLEQMEHFLSLLTKQRY